MSIIRVKKNENFFTASKEAFQNNDLSWEARGVLAYLMTKPGNWEVRVTDLIKNGSAGRDKIRRILKELEQYGYLKRIRVNRDDGQFDWVSEVYDSLELRPDYDPCTKTIKEPDTIDGFSGDGGNPPENGKTIAGKTIDGKPVDIIKNEFNNNEKNDNNYNYNKCPENDVSVNQLFDHFLKASKLKQPTSKITSDEWCYQIKELLVICDSDLNLAVEVVTDAIKIVGAPGSKYRLVAPKSIMSTISGLVAQKQREQDAPDPEEYTPSEVGLLAAEVADRHEPATQTEPDEWDLIKSAVKGVLPHPVYTQHFRACELENLNGTCVIKAPSRAAQYHLSRKGNLNLVQISVEQVTGRALEVEFVL